MTNEELLRQIISDLKRDFPKIKEIRTDNENIKIIADCDTLWEIFEVLYKGLNDVELNMGKDEEDHILIKI